MSKEPPTVKACDSAPETIHVHDLIGFKTALQDIFECDLHPCQHNRQNSSFEIASCTWNNSQTSIPLYKVFIFSMALTLHNIMNDSISICHASNTLPIPESTAELWLWTDLEKFFITAFIPVGVGVGITSNFAFLFTVMKIRRMQTLANFYLSIA